MSKLLRKIKQWFCIHEWIISRTYNACDTIVFVCYKCNKEEILK